MGADHATKNELPGRVSTPCDIASEQGRAKTKSAKAPLTPPRYMRQLVPRASTPPPLRPEQKKTPHKQRSYLWPEGSGASGRAEGGGAEGAVAVAPDLALHRMGAYPVAVGSGGSGLERARGVPEPRASASDSGGSWLERAQRLQLLVDAPFAAATRRPHGTGKPGKPVMHAQTAPHAELGLPSTSRHPSGVCPQQSPPSVIISPRALDAAVGPDAVLGMGAEGAKEGLDTCGAPQGSCAAAAAAAEPAQVWTVKKGESWLERAQRLQVLSATSRGSPPAARGSAAGHAVGSGGSAGSDDEGGWGDARGGVPGGRSASSSRGSQVRCMHARRGVACTSRVNPDQRKVIEGKAGEEGHDSLAAACVCRVP